MSAIEQVNEEVRTRVLCESLGVVRATLYRHRPGESAPGEKHGAFRWPRRSGQHLRLGGPASDGGRRTGEVGRPPQSVCFTKRSRSPSIPRSPRGSSRPVGVDPGAQLQPASLHHEAARAVRPYGVPAPRQPAPSARSARCVPYEAPSDFCANTRRRPSSARQRSSSRTASSATATCAASPRWRKRSADDGPWGGGGMTDAVARNGEGPWRSGRSGVGSERDASGW